ncbi:tryptophan halogenase family protein [Catenovulum adriaticum]|uniref:Tryptophan 7-halogenase n=1 Tax=Catenovulum adriaticum TaxID=2984846 RepID=A0ABY7ASZ3_9ALTE|nr:tryptophan halogenase family protein [Catenovulum sp. TS8]WAJ72246.1 tryptophan 7-halogenase [Catenovulum sp. TS8]
MQKPISSIVIVGGGTAGWITAGTLAAKLKFLHGNTFNVTLIESSNVTPIGVGEGTWPTMRRTLKEMGIRETDFIKQCKVSFKQGAKFNKWVTGEDDDFYYHPLMLPQNFEDFDLAPHWFNQSNNRSYSAAVCPQEAICELGLAPKHITTPEYSGVLNYAYHLDAAAFSNFLKTHCTTHLHVNRIEDDVIKVISQTNGDIESVVTQNNGKIAGDLFIDCTGFHGLLLDKHYKIPFVSCQDVLFADSALAVQVPYPDKLSPVASHTISTAQAAGWIWDIGLPTRRGVGHVYASQYMSDSEAEQTLLNYLKPSIKDTKTLNLRKISINPGYREKFWHKNCVAVGLSAGFLEPLEASALLLVEVSARTIAEQLPVNRMAMDIIAHRFNQTFSYRWQRIIDFLKLHYMLSQRHEPFWLANRDPKSIPEQLKAQLQLWQHQFPKDQDFEHDVEIFPAASYHYILYGMGFYTNNHPLGLSIQQKQNAQHLFSKNHREVNELSQQLKPNRLLLEKIYQFGLSKV